MTEKFDFEKALADLKAGKPITGKDSVLGPRSKMALPISNALIFLFANFGSSSGKLKGRMSWIICKKLSLPGSRSLFSITPHQK